MADAVNRITSTSHEQCTKAERISAAIVQMSAEARHTGILATETAKAAASLQEQTALLAMVANTFQLADAQEAPAPAHGIDACQPRQRAMQTRRLAARHRVTLTASA